MFKGISKLFPIFFCILCILTEVSGQDLIVTNNGDSLNVEIIKVTEDHIQYIYVTGNRLNRIKKPKTEIKYFQYIFYNEKRNLEYAFNPNQIKYRFSFNTGPAWRTLQAEEGANGFEKDYRKKINSGWSYKAEFNYFVKEKLALGALVDLYTTREKLENVNFIDAGAIGVLSDEIRITYLGPHFTYHIDTGRENFTLFAGAGTGFIYYNNDYKRIDPFNAKGNTLGYHLSLSTDFLLVGNLMVGIEVSGTLGVLRSLQITGDNGSVLLTNDTDINRFSFSIGLRFIK